MSSRAFGNWPRIVWQRFRGTTIEPIISILLVEYRDEVFARLAGDFLNLGLSVQRAATPEEAHEHVAHLRSHLIVMNRDLVGESGWLMVSKWCHPAGRRIWLYADWASAMDEAWVRLTKVEHILYCQGNIWRLSDQLIAALPNASLASDRSL